MLVIILDLIFSVIILLSLFMIPKSYKWWLAYALGCFLFIFVRLLALQYGSVILEVVAMNIGIRNYFKLKKEQGKAIKRRSK